MLRQLQGEFDTSSASLTPDGTYFVTAGHNREIHVWNLNAEERVAIYRDLEPLSALSAISPEGEFTVGTATGQVRFLKLTNLRLQAPIVTGVRRWLWKENTHEGEWDERIGARCPWCRHWTDAEEKLQNKKRSSVFEPPFRDS